MSAAPATGGKGRGRLVSEMPAAGNAGGTAETSNTNDGQRQEGDDIDLILDTMFVRRPQQPMTSSTTSSSGRAAGEKAPSKTGDIDDAMKVSGCGEVFEDIKINPDIFPGSSIEHGENWRWRRRRWPS